MIEFYNTSFYDKASGNYSRARYEGPVQSYTQYFFRKRLSLLIRLIALNLGSKKEKMVILEDGCADGIVLRKVVQKFPGMFSQAYGTDISPKMMEAAKARSADDQRFIFLNKNEIPAGLKVDCLLAVGFVSPGIFDEEFAFIKDHLNNNGLCFMSLISRNSLFARFKLKDKEIRGDYLDWHSYEKILNEHFHIVGSRVYGLFVPKLWAVPVLGRALQPLFESLFSCLPSLYHERLYVLRTKQ